MSKKKENKMGIMVFKSKWSQCKFAEKVLKHETYWGTS